jgi:hypothetical protein
MKAAAARTARWLVWTAVLLLSMTVADLWIIGW